MRTIIHDLEEKELKKIKFNSDDILISSLNCCNRCIGCFSCWVKHPKECCFKDNYSNITNNLKNSDEFIIISKNRYGCYDNKVKQVLERCIGYVLPYFTMRDNKIHHISRYKDKLKFIVYIYGNTTNTDRECLQKLIKANSINLNCSEYNIKYVNNVKELQKCIH